MRKNGINRQLLQIDGGVCAPSGFRANAMYCGISRIGISPSQSLQEGDVREDLGIIVGDNRYPTACVYPTGELCGAPVKICKRHCSLGLARAVIVNSQIANTFDKEGETQSESICRAIAQKLQTSPDEVLIASTGEVLQPYPWQTIVGSVSPLIDGLGGRAEHSRAVARVMSSEDEEIGEVSYSFYIGDYPCKIGAVFQGNKRRSQVMPTTLCFLTTDVNISTQMLQRALQTAVGETFGMLVSDAPASPNDTICIMSSRKAENYRISRLDSEYHKFEYALRETLFRICLHIAGQGAFCSKAIVYHVRGATSKRAAKSIAKALAGSIGLRKSIRRGELSLPDVLCAFQAGEASMDASRLLLAISSSQRDLVLVEEGKRMFLSSESINMLLSEEEIRITVDFQNGNFSARAVGSDLA